MEWQLRIYDIDPDSFDEWVREWRDHVAPLRRALGFEIVGPWVERDATRFVWLLGHDGREGFQEADDRYYASPQRRALEPDPARHIRGIETRMLRDVDTT